MRLRKGGIRRCQRDFQEGEDKKKSLRSDSIDTDTLGSFLLGRTLRHANDSMLAGAISRVLHEADQSSQAGRVDNTAASLATTALFDHVELSSQTVKQALAVDVHDLIELVVGKVPHRPGVEADAPPHDAGEVGRAVDRAAEVLGRPCHPVFDLGAVADVDNGGEDIGARVGQFFGKGGEAVLLQVGEGESGAAVGEKFGGRETYA